MVRTTVNGLYLPNSVLLNLSILDIWDWRVLCCGGAVLHMVGSLAATLASTHEMTIVLTFSWDDQWFYTLPNAPWVTGGCRGGVGVGSTPVKNHWSILKGRGAEIFRTVIPTTTFSELGFRIGLLL